MTLIVQGLPAQTADLVKIEDSSGSVLLHVDAAGQLHGNVTGTLTGNADTATGLSADIAESRVTNLVSDLAGCEQLANKDQPNGYPGLNSSGQIVGTFITRFDTAANIDTIVLAQGELATTTDTVELRIGDGATLGGRSLGANTAYAVSVTADGAAGANGAALRAGYALAKTLTPGGSALSATNRATVFVGPGTYDISSAGSLVLDTAYVDVIGVGGSAATIIFNDGVSGYAVVQNADNVTLQGLTLQSNTAITSVLIFQAGPGSTTGAQSNAGIRHTDVVFSVGSLGTSCMAFDAGITSLAGTYKQCSTNGQRMYGGRTFSGGVSATFIGCTSASANSFGSSPSSSAYNNFSGTMRNCRQTGNWFCKVSGLFEGNYIKATTSNNDAIRAYTGAVIQRNVLIPAGTGLPIGAVAADGAMNIVSQFNSLCYTAGNSGLHANLTNLITTPYNVVDPNVS